MNQNAIANSNREPASGLDLDRGERKIVMLVGISGAGKTTLAKMLAQRCRECGGSVITTIDRDDHAPDSAYADLRAFNRVFMGRRDAVVHDEIVAHSLALIERWRQSDANLIVVDRWYETYISECGLPQSHIDRIEQALGESGFQVALVHLVVGWQSEAEESDVAAVSNAILTRLAHTKAHRPAEWWDESRGSIEQRTRADVWNQIANGMFVKGSRFPSIRIDTTDMDWERCYSQMISSIKHEGSAGRGASVGRPALPRKLSESCLWESSRDIVHFVGICGAGKSTLSARLARRIASHGGKVVGTIDYDPHTPDDARVEERAFSRQLDQLNLAADCADPRIHDAIAEHTVQMIGRWAEADANVVLVDRWYESYDNLPRSHVEYIETAIQSSGFRVRHVFLVIGEGIFDNDYALIEDRMLHTKETRPAEWWANGPGALDAWVRAEQECQEAYRVFLRYSPFSSLTMNTTEMEWEQYVDEIVGSMIQERWFEDFEKMASRGVKPGGTSGNQSPLQFAAG